MPTGRTHMIRKGANFKEFATECLKKFTDSDEHSDEFVPSCDYQKDALREQGNLRELKNVSAEEAEKRARSEYKQSLKIHKEILDQKVADFKKYQDILENVIDFKPPTKDHEAYKNFMVEQILTGIKSDCRDLDGTVRSIVTARPLTGEEWLAEAKTSIKKEIDNNYERHARAIETVKEFASTKKWLKEAQQAIEDHATPKSPGKKKASNNNQNLPI